MATLYITEQGSTLHKEQNRLVVTKDEAELASLHEFKVERVVIFGNVQLTTQAVAFLLDRGIETSFLSTHGHLKGRLAPLDSKNIPLRLKQYERTQDAELAASIARTIVRGKIGNCSEVLARHARNHPECDLRKEIDKLSVLAKQSARQESIESLRGVEGRAAAVYFQGFGRMLRKGMTFAKRTRRPPADPVNSLLSFGYTLLYSEAISALVAAGFDPYLGFYHSLHYGRCSLALDLIEELRPLTIDRLTLTLVNREVLKAADFRKEKDNGVRLRDAGRKRYLEEYERMMNAEFPSRQTGQRTSMRTALHAQALALQRTITEGSPYQSFKGWH